jgi:hypothetical protein
MKRDKQNKKQNDKSEIPPVVQPEIQPGPISEIVPSPLHADYLLEQARGEETRRLLDDYTEVISVLRDEKKFTFREIAEWLQARDVEADHNAVYRAYTKGMPEGDAIMAGIEDEEDERQDAQG